MRSIKIVKAVAYAYNTQLAGMVETSNRSVRLPSTVEWHDINIKPHPSLVSSSKSEDNNRVVTTTLKLITSNDLYIRRRHLVFRVTLTDDRQYLVGARQRPYPQIEITENAPENVTDNQLNEVVITYKSHEIPPFIQV